MPHQLKRPVLVTASFWLLIALFPAFESSQSVPWGWCRWTFIGFGEDRLDSGIMVLEAFAAVAIGLIVWACGAKESR